jgi:hypothetical protein
MRNRKLTGPWAGFSFERGVLVTPEGRYFGPEDLRWLSLTVTIKQEWCRMMEECRRRERGKALPARDASVTYLRDVLRERLEEKRSSVGSGRVDAGRHTAGRPGRGPRRPRRG